MYSQIHHSQFARPSQPGPSPISMPQQSIQHSPYVSTDMSMSNAQPPEAGPVGASNSSPPANCERDKEEEDAMYKLAGPEPVSREFDGRAWALQIVQQPLRARMCGFGDKDRRPISPPPCIRLVIIDAETGHEVDYSKYDNLSRFVLMVDLSNVETSEEKNMVKHTSASPSISSVITTSYPPTLTHAPPAQYLPKLYVGNIPAYGSQHFATPQAAPAQTPNNHQTNGGHQQYYGNGVSQYGRTASPYGENRYSQYPPTYHSAHQMVPPPSQPDNRLTVEQQRTASTGMVTRNLIGSLSGSAFRLNNIEGDSGLWFVFQDLSIRTEGWFRLKFTFFDLMGKVQPDDTTFATLSQLAPMLACAYSQPFKVYSAKRFPGVIESTELSRKFASQGIKIPIRKDANKPAKRNRDEPASDSEELGGEEDE